jgi:hypothetical protein
MRPLALIPVLLLAACATAGPPPLVEGARLVEDLRVLSADDMEGRAPATPGGEKARAYVLQRLQQAGVQPLPSGWTHSFTFSPRREPTRTLTGVNVMGQVRGTKSPDRYIVVTAHYDHVGVREGQIYNGADDNASGTAALIAMAEHFARHKPEHSILFVALDAEEQGLQGARAFVANPPVPKAAMVLNINMDMVSRGDTNRLYAVGTHPWPFLRPHIEAVAQGAPVPLLTGHDTPDLSREDNWVHQSDHYAFHQAGIPFIYFGVDNHPDYHQPTDDFAKVQQPFFRGSVQTIASAIRRFDQNLGEIAAARAAFTPPAAAAGGS